MKLVLFGIGVSGFCALGYEVLWTRILTLTIGTSVYGFTIMLIAFLTGIALGSNAYGLIFNVLLPAAHGVRNRILGFGAVQFMIGAAALAVAIHKHWSDSGVLVIPVSTSTPPRARGSSSLVRLLSTQISSFVSVYFVASC